MLLRDLDDRGIRCQLRGPAPMRGAERKERDIRDPALARKLDHLLVLAVDDAVAVLDLGYVDELERVPRRCGIDVGEPDQIELALPSHIRKREQLVLERYRAVGSGLDQAQIHEVETLHPERVEVRLDSFAQLVGSLCGKHASYGVPPRPDLGHQLEVVGVRIERLADQVVDHIRAVVLRSVDVIDAESMARRSTARAASGSWGGPNTPGPASCIAP